MSTPFSAGLIRPYGAMLGMFIAWSSVALLVGLLIAVLLGSVKRADERRADLALAATARAACEQMLLPRDRSVCISTPELAR